MVQSSNSQKKLYARACGSMYQKGMAAQIYLLIYLPDRASCPGTTFMSWSSLPVFLWHELCGEPLARIDAQPGLHVEPQLP
jgi:hypothetical protein